MLGDSTKLDWKTELAGPFDLIFIDGGHKYDAVRRDTQNAMESVATGGLIVWHDYGMIQDVSRAVDEAAVHMRVSAIRGTRLAVAFAP